MVRLTEERVASLAALPGKGCSVEELQALAREVLYHRTLAALQAEAPATLLPRVAA